MEYIQAYDSDASDTEQVISVDVDASGGSDNEEEDQVCTDCGGTPCDWYAYGFQIMQELSKLYEPNSESDVTYIRIADWACVNASSARKAAYKMFIYMKYGHLGKGVRIPVPRCVVAEIRDKFPDANEEYMGFYDA